MFEPTQYLFDGRDSIPIERIFRAVFRTEFTQPGFALIRMPGDTDSLTLRRSMVILKDDLSRLYVQQFQHSLTYLSLARFNQQVTTKFHLDGSPETAFLMFGVVGKMKVGCLLRLGHEKDSLPGLTNFRNCTLLNSQPKQTPFLLFFHNLVANGINY